jgi:hypothetical protein
LIRTARDATTRTSISTPRNRPAILVEIDTPRIIIQTASPVRITVRMPQGMSRCRYRSRVMARKPPEMAITDAIATM